MSRLRRLLEACSGDREQVRHVDGTLRELELARRAGEHRAQARRLRLEARREDELAAHDERELAGLRARRPAA